MKNAMHVVVTWGSEYGNDPSAPMTTPEGVTVWLYRKGQRCRWYDRKGVQVGPEQSNVAPALCYAYGNGWSDRSMRRLVRQRFGKHANIATAVRFA